MKSGNKSLYRQMSSILTCLTNRYDIAFQAELSGKA
jgi:hypothetical protein